VPTAAAPLPASTPSPAPPIVVHVITGWRRAVARLLGRVMRLWASTLRLRTDAETLRLLTVDQAATMFMLWHSRGFVAAELSRRLRPGRPLHGLVSTSRDGAWLTAFFESVGLRVVRGSSSRGGREAVKALVDVLRAGHDVGLTPDGPRGPAEVLKPGALVIARRAGARVLLVGIHHEECWRLPSWDSYNLPRPFGTVWLRVREADASLLRGPDALPHLENMLRELNAAAPEAARGPAVL
jgi:lysophospholipid acyltransferase (LPLAT)-like uncharacterized protein